MPAMPKLPAMPADAEETDDEDAAAQPEEESLEEFLSEDGAEEEAPEQGGDKKAKKAKKSKRDSRRFRYGSMATAVTAVVAVLVVVLNVVVSLLADRFPINIDLTQNKLFSLSDNSVAIAKSIDKDVQVIVFGSEDLYKNPNLDAQYYQLEALYKEIYKALQQYTSYSGGKVTVKYEDLNLNPQLATQYNKYEVTSGDILLLCGDRYQKVSFNDMFEISGDGYTQAQTVSSKVELTLASRIKNVMKDKVQVITAFVGHEEDENTVSALKSIYEANGYDFKELNLASSEEIDAGHGGGPHCRAHQGLHRRRNRAAAEMAGQRRQARPQPDGVCRLPGGLQKSVRVPERGVRPGGYRQSRYGDQPDPYLPLQRLLSLCGHGGHRFHQGSVRLGQCTDPPDPPDYHS